MYDKYITDERRNRTVRRCLELSPGEAQFIKNIGFRIQYFRRKADLSQEQLAEMSDLSYSTISHIESTIDYTMSLRAIYRISRALGVLPYQLLMFD